LAAAAAIAAPEIDAARWVAVEWPVSARTVTADPETVEAAALARRADVLRVAFSYPAT